MPANAATVAQVLREHARSRGDHPLLICDAERISYAQADRESARLARGLIALGAGKGTHVGLLYPDGVPFLVGVLAAARIGAVVVPFSTFATAREVREQLLDSDVAVLLGASSYRSHDYVCRLRNVLSDADVDSEETIFSTAVPQLRHIGISYADDANRRTRDIEHIHRLAAMVDDALLEAMEGDVDGSDPLTIVYTSGSSSAPKGVVNTHAALLGHQRNLNQIRGLTVQDKMFCNSPFFWIGGIGFAVLATLVAGSTLVCSNATDAGEILDLLEAERPTMTNGFVAGIAQLARHPTLADRDLSSMRRGNLFPLMAPETRPADPELRHNMLGMTETGSVNLLSGDDTDQPEHRRGSFGKPAPGFDTKIVDPDTGEIVEPGDVGEFCVRGPHVMQRYYGRSREDCFDGDGWFHTGDLVRTDSDGYHYFIGRRDAMIKTAGANVAPAEVEKAIAKVTGGVTAHVVGIPDAERGQIVAAVVVTDDVTGFDLAALKDALKSELSAYKIPRRFVALSESDVPMLSSGKLDVPRLKAVFDG
jgi:acyl-CoA synthetase (AMP-forming)/AMP-acid ligase II